MNAQIHTLTPELRAVLRGLTSYQNLDRAEADSTNPATSALPFFGIHRKPKAKRFRPESQTERTQAE